MMRLLIDANVILDVLFARPPHSVASQAVWDAVEKGAAEGLLAAHAVTTIHYFIRKERGNVEAARILATVLGVFGVAPVEGSVLREALAQGSTDFEDAVTSSAANRAGCILIVTRDPRGFRHSPVRAVAPDTALALLAGRGR